MKRWLLACLTMLCMVALLVGCGSDTAKQGKQGKHMNVGLYWFGETLDPTHEWDAWTLTRIGAGETLATVTPDMKFTPQLADSWENVDPTTWKFHIRENVKFHIWCYRCQCFTSADTSQGPRIPLVSWV